MAFASIAWIVFGPGLRAGFVSDAWIFLERAQRPWSELVPALVPRDPVLWRPAVSLTFWMEYRLFGLDPFGYHLVALASHLMTAALVGFTGWHLTRRIVPSISAAAAFAFTFHAHEVVYDVADLHNAIGGPLLVGAVLAFLRGSPWLTAGLTLAAFLVDEAALLVLPLAALYALLWRGGWERLLPVGIITGLYVVWRAVAGVDEYVADPCRDAGCIIRGSAEYLGRLIARPDVLLARRMPSIIAAAVAVAVVALAIRPRRLRHWQTIIFGAGWASGASLLYLLALYPYVADRFLYIPSMGLAVAIAGVIAELERRWQEGHRWAAATVSLGLIIWIGTGAVMLHQRGGMWAAAGDRALHIVNQTVALHPDPAQGAAFVFEGVPHSLEPQFPPGNTGPYVFNNGLPHALRLMYGRTDITAVRSTQPAPSGAPDVYHLRIDRDGSVSRVRE